MWLLQVAALHQHIPRSHSFDRTNLTHPCVFEIIYKTLFTWVTNADREVLLEYQRREIDNSTSGYANDEKAR